MYWCFINANKFFEFHHECKWNKIWSCLCHIIVFIKNLFKRSYYALNILWNMDLKIELHYKWINSIYKYQIMNGCLLYACNFALLFKRFSQFATVFCARCIGCILQRNIFSQKLLPQLFFFRLRITHFDATHKFWKKNVLQWNMKKGTK